MDEVFTMISHIIGTVAAFLLFPVLAILRITGYISGLIVKSIVEGFNAYWDNPL